MASLSPGVLEKLLQGMEASGDEPAGPDCPLPALLQVTSILPALAADLSPDSGFYLKLSDASHSVYAALPHEHNDIILADRLRIGQLVHVTRLDPHHPVPILRGLRPLPTRLPCLPDTASLLPDPLSPAVLLADPLPPAAIELKTSWPAAGPAPLLTPPLPDGKKRQPADRKSLEGGPVRSRSKPTSPLNSTARRLERRRSDIPTSNNDGYDSDGTLSSYSTLSGVLRLKTARRSWEDPGRVKHEPKPVVHRRSSSVSPCKSLHSGTSKPKDRGMDDLLAIRKETEAFKILRSSSRRNTNVECSCKTNPSSSFSEVKWPVNNIAWESLPSSLVKHGKEAIRQRDLALNAALDALQEACASEKLIHCLSIYLELESNKEKDPQHLIDRFLDMHKDLMEARSVVPSLSKLSPSRTPYCNLVKNGELNVKVAKITMEKRKCAASWITAAMKSGLLKSPTQLATTIASDDSFAINEELPNPIMSYTEPKCKCTISKQMKNSDVLPATALATTLHYECNRWFLSYIEEFLAAVEDGRSYSSCESQIASLLYLLKRVDDWLDSITSKGPLPSYKSKSSTMEGEEAEACGRVRKKIYGILLRHVETAAVALENMSAMEEVTDQPKEMLE